VITSAFQEAFANIRNQLKVQIALDKAATTIDIDLQDNQGYPNVAPKANSKSVNIPVSRQF
jgi:multiple sugar transport system substrate-binding protein